MKKDWFEDETFWTVLYPYMFPAKRLAEAGSEVEKVLSLLRLSTGRVLDLCCGPGRHSIELARRQFSVVGVDRTAYLLSMARTRATDENLAIEFVAEDMRNFHRHDEFDAALSLFTSFGYFADESENLRVLRNVHSSLRVGGQLLIDVISKEWLASNFSETTSDQGEDGEVIFRRHEITDDWTRIRNHWVLLSEEERFSWEFSHSIYSGRELRSLLFEAGFRKVALFGDLDGKPYGRDATRLVAVAQKERG